MDGLGGDARGDQGIVGLDDGLGVELRRLLALVAEQGDVGGALDGREAPRALAALDQRLGEVPARALEVEDAPSLVVLRSHIGYPLPDSIDTSAAHGAITDADEIARAKQIMGLPVDQPFHVANSSSAFSRYSGITS